MIKYIYNFTVTFFIFISNIEASTWEKLYKRSGADCFRDVHELSNGDFFATGYTNYQSTNDTDGLAVRYNFNGDIIWTYEYNSSVDDNDGFYKGIPTSDGGYILCGFTNISATDDDALIVKLDSLGTFQWDKSWGGSDFERAKDIIELPGGGYIVVGYTSSSGAQDFDMFMIKLNQSGSTVWSKLFGDATYDEANTVIQLPDGGFLVGGIGNEDFYLVRTNSSGNEIWSEHLGTSGIDLIKCIVFAQGGNGYALAGTTTGVGAGGEDAYLVRTDTSGNMLWSQYYGGPLDDGFQRINTTSDGGYIGIGTSRLGPWPDPNLWLYKLDAAGNLTWQKFFGGDAHDHGYCARETSDGGYIVSGHSRSFGSNNPLPDAMLIKTDVNGNAQDKLTYTTVSRLVSPVSSNCGLQNFQVVVEVANFSDTTVANIPVTIDITGAITQTISQTYNTPVLRDDTVTVTFSTLIDLSAAGTYYFHCFTGNDHDVYPDRNYLDKTIVINTSATNLPIVTSGSQCGPGTVSLSASSPNTVRWYNNNSGSTLLYTGLNYTTAHLTSSTTYYVRAGTQCPSALIPAIATIHPLPVINLGPDSVYTSQSNFMIDAGIGYTDYLWSTSSTSQTITVINSGTYCVTVTDTNSCVDTACMYVGFVNGINELTFSSIKFYPSPINGIVTIEVPHELSNSRLNVFDLTGKNVFSYTISNTKETIDLSLLSRGIYFAQISGNNSVVSGKFIVD